jgi:hypothetical protein
MRRWFDAEHWAATTCSSSVAAGAKSVAKRERAIHDRDSYTTAGEHASSRVCVVLDEIGNDFR